MTPLISILMPVLDCEATIEAAVRSILAQTCNDWELLIIDDGSTDRTRAIACRLQDRQVRLFTDAWGTLGLAARLNQGVALARGRYIARMDGDDVSLPERLQRQLRYLEYHPEVDLLGCGMFIFRGDGDFVGVQQARRGHAEICGSATRSCLLPHATWMGHAGWFRRNRYDEALKRCEDRELLLRSRRSSRFAGLPEPLYGYRVNGISLRKNAVARMEYARAAMRDAAYRRDWLRWGVAGAAEMAKLAFDFTAIATGKEGTLLRHRFGEDDPLSRRRWRAFWQTLSRSETALA